jgi:hypothetical protein
MDSTDPELVPALNQSLEINLAPVISYEELRKKLASHFNQLIQTDFEKLIFLLYRIDVNEARMRALLAQREGEDAPGLIADLVIERQLQKIESRRKYKQEHDEEGEEKW